jgi:hypothetical protein
MHASTLTKFDYFEYQVLGSCPMGEHLALDSLVNRDFVAKFEDLE